MKIGDTPFFKTAPPILPTSPFLWEKSGPPPFFSKVSKTQPPLPPLTPLYKGGERFQLCFIFFKLRK